MITILTFLIFSKHYKTQMNETHAYIIIIMLNYLALVIIVFLLLFNNDIINEKVFILNNKPYYVDMCYNPINSNLFYIYDV